MECKFLFNQEFEVERVSNTLKKISWYREQGYRPALPEGVNESSTLKEIEIVIDSEFDTEVYEVVKRELETRLEHNRHEIETAFLTLGLECPSELKVFLTRYGVGGSYNPPDTVILSLRMQDPFKTLIHELVHLSIQSDIEKNHIEHWDKERIVDLITHEPEFAFVQIKDWQKDANPRIDRDFRTRFTSNREQFFVDINKD